MYATCSQCQVDPEGLNGLLGFPQLKLQDWTGIWIKHTQASNQEKGNKNKNKKQGWVWKNIYTVCTGTESMQSNGTYEHMQQSWLSKPMNGVLCYGDESNQTKFRSSCLTRSLSSRRRNNMCTCILNCIYLCKSFYFIFWMGTRLETTF